MFFPLSLSASSTHASHARLKGRLLARPCAHAGGKGHDSLEKTVKNGAFTFRPSAGRNSTPRRARLDQAAIRSGRPCARAALPMNTAADAPHQPQARAATTDRLTQHALGHQRAGLPAWPASPDARPRPARPGRGRWPRLPPPAPVRRAGLAGAEALRGPLRNLSAEAARDRWHHRRLKAARRNDDMRGGQRAAVRQIGRETPLRPGAQALDPGRQPDGQREAPCIGLQVIRELIAAGITCASPARAMPGRR